MRISVLLPEPDGPHTTTTSPASTPGSMSAQDVELAEPLVDAAELDAPAPWLLDDHEDVARVHRLARLHPDLATVPAAGALNSFSIFMASITSRVSPGLDRLARPHGDVGDLTRKRAP